VDVIDEVALTHPGYTRGQTFAPWDGVAHLHSALASLIDHRRHVGFAYDFYGELLKLHNSQFFMRPPGKSDTKWHNDGARAVPHAVYSPDVCMQLKVAYWLTDLPDDNMGNLVVAPGSHKSQYFDHYRSLDDVPGQVVVRVPAGTMMLINGNIFHKVQDNNSSITRYNMFYTYCPSWVCAADRYLSDKRWLQTLTREQRIIMRSYEDPYACTKPPAEDFPLYLDRVTGLDHDGDAEVGYANHLRKRLVAHEKSA
jgi:hypothetical protein